MPRKKARPGTDKRLSIVVDALEDKKAVDVDIIPMEGRTLIADYFVLATGTSSVHIRTLAEAVEESFEAKTGDRVRREGEHTGNWVLLDCGDIVAHVFTQEARETYSLDSLWKITQEAREAPREGEPETS